MKFIERIIVGAIASAIIVRVGWALVRAELRELTYKPGDKARCWYERTQYAALAENVASSRARDGAS